MKKYLKYLQRLFPLVLLVLSLGATAQTGVDVSNSTNYGSSSWGVGTAPNSFNVSGPYDATTNSATTSVGGTAIYRFTRPVCYQGFPDSSLPEPLQNSNPLGILRLVDNDYNRNPIS